MSDFNDRMTLFPLWHQPPAPFARLLCGIRGHREQVVGVSVRTFTRPDGQFRGAGSAFIVTVCQRCHRKCWGWGMAGKDGVWIEVTT